MTIPPIVLLGAIFVGVAVGVFALSSLLAGQTTSAERLKELRKGWQFDHAEMRKKSGKSPLEKKKHKEELAGKIFAPLSKLFSGGSQSEGLREQLMFAGLRSQAAMSIFFGVKAAVGVAMPITVLLYLLTTKFPPAKIMMITAIVMIIGLRLPNFWLGSKAKKRKSSLTVALPDALDLLVVCVESGLGLDMAMSRIADEIEDVYPEMSDELKLVNLEMRAGASRADALRNLGIRTGVDDVKALAARLVQSDKFGTSIAKSLRTHSETLRNKRRQRAEEAAAKTTVKLLFPLVFFIFPALFIVLLGPAAINVYEVLGKNMH